MNSNLPSWPLVALDYSQQLDLFRRPCLRRLMDRHNRGGRKLVAELRNTNQLDRTVYEAQGTTGGSAVRTHGQPLLRKLVLHLPVEASLPPACLAHFIHEYSLRNDSDDAGVQVAQRWIIAALRHRKFFQLGALNEAIADLLDRLNHRPFRKRPIPATPFCSNNWTGRRSNRCRPSATSSQNGNRPKSTLIITSKSSGTITACRTNRYTSTTVVILSRGAGGLACPQRCPINRHHTRFPSPESAPHARSTVK